MKIIPSHTSFLLCVLHWIWNCFLFLSFLCYCCYLKWFHHALTDWLDRVFIFRVKFYFVSFFLLGKNKKTRRRISRLSTKCNERQRRKNVNWPLLGCCLVGWFGWRYIWVEILYCCFFVVVNWERARFSCQSIATAVMCYDCIGALPFSFIGLYLNQN